MDKSDISTYAKSDQRYLELIGDFIKSVRIQQRLTQVELSVSAGINRSTLVYLEKGNPVNLLSLIQVLRALRRLDALERFQPVRPQVSPLKMAALEQDVIQRVRKPAPITRNKHTKSDW